MWEKVISNCILDDPRTKVRHFLIDTDTASDDAVALILALQNPQIQVEAITVVAGNVPLTQGIQNALYTVELCGKEIPVFAGSEKPLNRPLETAQFVHGDDGMGDIGLLLQGREPAAGDALEVIPTLINQLAGEIELVTLGPLTNIARCLQSDPSLAQKVKLCTMMGGIGREHGNITPVSEYNVWTDPEAAQIVFGSGIPLRMVGWDISRNYAWMDETTASQVRAINTPLSKFAMDIQQTVNTFAKNVSKLPGFDLPDPIAMAIAIDPSLILESKRLYVEVITANDVTRGQTVVDHMSILNRTPNVEVVLEASREKFLSMLKGAL